MTKGKIVKVAALDANAPEEYAALERGGYVYAVRTRGGQRLRFHDTEALGAILGRWKAAAGELLMFTGAPDGSSEPDGDDEHEVSTGAGAVLGPEVIAIAYWSPQDDAATDAAYDSAAALLEALTSAAQPNRDDGLRV